jgi:hypothetical protein
VVRRKVRRGATGNSCQNNSAADGAERQSGPDNPAARVMEIKRQGDPDKLKLELQLQHFIASGLTDRSGGGSSASHDAATDTGRKPAPTQTIFDDPGDPKKHLTPNIQRPTAKCPGHPPLDVVAKAGRK